jgi:Flp pilus assembly protein TadB
LRKTNLDCPCASRWSTSLKGLTASILKRFRHSVLLQRETGGKPGRDFGKDQLHIRERFKLMGQIRTYTAPGRWTMWVLGSMPVVFALVINAINPDYFAPLLESSHRPQAAADRRRHADLWLSGDS